MNTIVIEHVNISELPDAWRARVRQPANHRVTVRIEEEIPAEDQATQSALPTPLFGLWRDRDDMKKDVAAYVRAQRAARQERITAPAASAWDSFFLGATTATEDFMA